MILSAKLEGGINFKGNIFLDFNDGFLRKSRTQKNIKYLSSSTGTEFVKIQQSLSKSKTKFGLTEE